MKLTRRNIFGVTAALAIGAPTASDEPNKRQAAKHKLVTIERGGRLWAYDVANDEMVDVTDRARS